MNSLKAKLQKQEGFTLVELLIVVALIAILAAISIPMVGENLEKARIATDRANARSAIALASAEVLGSEKPVDDGQAWAYVASGANKANGVLKKLAVNATEDADALAPKSKKLSEAATPVKGLIVTYHTAKEAVADPEADAVLEHFTTTFDAVLADAAPAGESK